MYKPMSCFAYVTQIQRLMTKHTVYKCQAHPSVENSMLLVQNEDYVFIPRMESRGSDIST